MPSLPNFLIIGAAKSGTTALYQYLKQHPQIFLSPHKEPKFFAHEGKKPGWKGPGDERYDLTTVTDIATYLALFHEVTDEKAIGEASTQYLYMPGVRERIKYYIPTARLIAILRNPVEVAYSAYLHKRRDGHEPLTEFAEALRQEETRIKNNWSPIWHYRQRGFFYEHLVRYFELFPREQLRIYLHDDLKTDAAGMVRDIFRFIEVDDTCQLDLSLRPNVSGIPKDAAVHRFLTGKSDERERMKATMPEAEFRRMIDGMWQSNLEKPHLSPAVRTELVKTYKDDVSRLQDLLDRDLSHWLL
jgi:hypothetical protein